MRHLISLLVLALAVASFGAVSPVAASSPQGAHPALTGVVPGQYIVTLKAGVRPTRFLASSGIATKSIYDAALNGFSAKLSLGQLAALRRNPSVVRIEQDQYVSLSITQTPVTWGLDRVDQTSLPLSNTYVYNTTASNVNVYVLDTGIQTGHPQFSGRAAVAYDTVSDGFNGQDCDGHGTHVAGTIGSTAYGVAKGVRLWSVRVLGCGIPGTLAGVINGINWVADNHRKPAVANLSLGGSANSSLDTAVANLISRGVTVVVAAGNENQNACNVSPARVPGALTVAASDRTDTRASFSNYGACVDLYAPGVSITSTWLNSGTNTISGTSMSSPHVAGVAALYLAGNPTATPATVSSWIITNATPNKIINNPAGTPNRLLYKSTL
jgi:subtilisin family serine protease